DDELQQGERIDGEATSARRFVRSDCVGHGSSRGVTVPGAAGAPSGHASCAGRLSSPSHRRPLQPGHASKGVRMNGKPALVVIAALSVVAAGVGAGASSGAQSASCVVPRGGQHVSLDPAGFTTRITNPWWPMHVGSRWLYRETNPDGTKQRDVVVVLPKTKE